MKSLVKSMLLGGLMLASFGKLPAAESTAEAEVFSVEAYCILANAGAPAPYLKAYENRLGSKPSREACKALKEATASLTPPKWNFHGNRPYPGSIIHLSNEQVEILKKSQVADAH